jgi:hypothetical protein
MCSGRSKKWCFLLRSIAVGVCCSHAIAIAQVQAGRIVGTIFDPQRAAVPGATVTVTNEATKLSRSVITGETGGFVVTPLNPGMYTLRATAAGFSTTTRGGIELVVGEAVRVDLELRLGETAVEVRVVADAPLLSTESATLGQVVTNTQIVNLPLNGRSFHELARLTPGAVLLPATGALAGGTNKTRPENYNGNIIGGMSGWQSTFLMDGVDVTEQHQGGTWINTSIDALQEFSVQQSAYTAEYARGGGFFNATTKSGSRDFHGALFEFLRNDKLDARNFFARTREVLKRNQFGGTIGGPVVIPKVFDGSNNTFFFLAYEARRERQGVIFNEIVPSLAQRSGDFRGLNRIYDPLTTAPNPAGGGNVRTQFLNNVIPQNRLSSQALFFSKYISAPNTPGGTWAYSPSRAINADQITFRLDREITPNHRAFARFSWVDNRQTDPAQFPELGDADLRSPARNVAVALTSNVRANMVHEFRASYLFGQYRSYAYFEGQGAAINRQLGLTGLEALQDEGLSSLPSFTFTGYRSYAGNGNDGRPKWQDRWTKELTDTLTWIKGKHIVKFGTRIHYYRPLFTDTRNHNGTFSFTGISTENPASPTGTGDGFADFLLGYPATGGRGNPATWWGGYGTYWHFFAQDDLKVSNSLTLNLGVRYEYSPWLKAYRGQISGFDATRPKSIIVGCDCATSGIDLDAQPAARVGFDLFKDLIQTTKEAGLPEAVTRPDKRNWAPRIGLAWRPFGEGTVIRAGYGIFYESESTNTRHNFSYLPWRLDESIAATRGATPTRTLANYFLGVPFGASVGAVTWKPEQDFMRTGYNQRWSFGIQRLIRNSLVLDATYSASKGSFLIGQTSVNSPEAGPGNIQARRPFPRFGSFVYNDQNESATYHSLQLKAERRLSAGLWYLFSYTWSKSLLHENTPAVGGNFAWEKGLNTFDVPHNFVSSFGYELPFGRGKRFLGTAGALSNALLGGWQAQGIIGFRSGLPFTPTVSRDVANIGVGDQRPNRIGSGKLDNPTLDLYFDKSAFAVPANFTYGNSGRSILRGDYLGSVDFSVFKVLPVTERSSLQFRAEVFNLPNSAYLNNPGNNNVDVAAGGRVTSTSNTPRQIQFGLKYSF